MIIPDFKPDPGVKIQANDSDPDPNAAASNDEADLQKIAKSLPAPKSLAGFKLEPVKFEKDDDSNHHIDFITAASNLRAQDRMRQLASNPRLIIPGHDPAIFERFHGPSPGIVLIQ